MHIVGITPIGFYGKREDRNTVSKLSRDNAFSLNEMNQRKINEAIDSLADVQSESNVKFLLSTAKNLKYGTNIPSDKQVRNDWRQKLNGAVTDAIKGLPESAQAKYTEEADKVFGASKELSSAEKRILENKEKILGSIDRDALASLKDKNERNLETNLEYFIISTETTTKQKDYVLKRLAHFMSDDYKINPQLKGKKTQVLAEMVNDLVITTPESEIPNIKSVNQRSHGMCGDISISRKALAYEDKPNYVDAIMSELDDSEFVMVYDRTNLGSGKRVPAHKADVDYDYACAKGYRIVDAAALNWMQIAAMYGSNNEVLDVYHPFDKDNFDVYHDAYFNPSTEEPEFSNDHAYYQALIKAKEVIGDVKAGGILRAEKDRNIRKSKDDTIAEMGQYASAIKSSIQGIIPDADADKADKAFNAVIKLEVSSSDKIAKSSSEFKQYMYIPNEEQSVKTAKISKLLTEQFGAKASDEDMKNASANILELASVYNGLKSQTSTNSLKQTEITKAKKMYSAEAAYRNQFIKSLQIPEVKDYYMTKLCLQDTESEILNGFDHLLGRLKNDKDGKLVKLMADNFGLKPDKEEVIDIVSQMAADYEDMLTNGLDTMYGMIMSGDRQHVLKTNLDIYKDALKSASAEQISGSAKVLGVKPEIGAITEKLDSLQKDLDDPDNYSKVFNAIGMKSQIGAFEDVYMPMRMFILGNEQMRQAFNQNNGLNKNASIEETNAVLDTIDNMFGILIDITDKCQQIFETKDENGNAIYPIKPEPVIIKSMENQGKLIPASTMTKLRDRFTKIDQVKNEDHMSGKRGKISDKSLLQLSNEEKEAVNKISKDLNKKYAEVSRNLTDEFRKIRTPLAELKRYIGLNSGHYWVQPEGSSGMTSGTQVKIFEQLTDRPYYDESDKRKAIDKMKNSDYSGVSGTSVSHNYVGMHAQYVADIVDTEINGEKKEVLYHDNTWGACEDENTWVDSAGMTRTDYACDRGGALGYITNDRMFNGNIVDNMMKKGQSSSSEIESKAYRRLKGSGGSHKFDMFTDAIVSGVNPGAKSIVGRIKDNCFASSVGFMKTLEAEASKMTKAELKSAFERIENAGMGYKPRYNDLEDKIEKNETIKSAEDFEKLSDDKLKLSLEKVALRQSLDNYDLLEEIAAAKTKEDLAAVKQKQIDFVNNKFDYAFAKDKNIAKFITKTNQQESLNVLAQILNSDGPNVDDKTLVSILDAAENIPDDKFDGSLKNTINIMCENITKAVSKNVPNVDETKLQSLEKTMNKYMHSMMDFSVADINNSSVTFGQIREIVDKKYDPATNGEFAKIYKNLQNMTKEEFAEEMKDITLEDKGLKTVTAYDVFSKIQNDDDSTKSELKNSLFYEELIKDMKFSDTTTEYQYSKFSQKKNGTYYKNGERTFDDVYRDFYYTLSNMELDKLSKQMFDSGVREYGVFPAFPSVQVVDEEGEYKRNCDMLNSISEVIWQINNIRDIFELSDISDELSLDLDKLNSDNNLTDEEYTLIDKNLSRVAKLVKNEDSCTDLINDINDLLSDKSRDKLAYASVITESVDIINGYKALVNGTSLKDLTSNAKRQISDSLNEIVSMDVILKYAPRVRQDINKWIHAEQTKSPDAKELYNVAVGDLMKYSKLNYPTEVLKEYLYSHAKDNKANYGDKDVLQAYCKNLLSLANIVEMQEILMDIVSSGDMSSVKKQLHEKTVEFMGKNGEELVYTMDSDEVLTAMVDTLTLKNDVSVAAMFTEKLGITDRMVKIKADSINFKECEKAIDKLETVVQSQKEQYNVIDDEFVAQIAQINNDNYAEIIDNLKVAASDKTSKMKYRYALKKFNELMDAMKKQLDNDKSTPVEMIADGYRALFQNQVNDLCMAKVNDFNEKMDALVSVYRYINTLYIPEYSDSYKIKEDFMKKFDELSYKVQAKTEGILGSDSEA